MIDKPTGPSLRRLALGDLEHELANTRRVLERLPDDQFSWQPHDKSMSLGRLAEHLAELPAFAQAVVEHDEIDFAKGLPIKREKLTDRAKVLAAFDANAASLTKVIDAATDEQMRAKFTARTGDHVIAAMPRVAALRTMAISHVIHHRGQLTVYLREVGVPVPGMYGPSADER